MQTLNEKLPQVPKENAFHFIRLACCLIVIYEHAAVLCDAGIPCLNLRGMAVDVFFILSGFWVTLSYLKSSSAKGYALKRIRWIFPQYAATVVLCAVLLASFSSLELRAYFSSSGFWKYLAANLCTLNFLHPSLPGVFGDVAVNGSLWTIKIELAFYVLLPAVIFFAHAVERKFDMEEKKWGGVLYLSHCTCFQFYGRCACRA
ncbi:MAG: acyltransferase [Treponema sp.]|nr:acyltransferase [Treponema sp.]